MISSGQCCCFGRFVWRSPAHGPQAWQRYEVRQRQGSQELLFFQSFTTAVHVLFFYFKCFSEVHDCNSKLASEGGSPLRVHLGADIAVVEKDLQVLLATRNGTGHIMIRNYAYVYIQSQCVMLCYIMPDQITLHHIGHTASWEIELKISQADVQIISVHHWRVTWIPMVCVVQGPRDQLRMAAGFGWLSRHSAFTFFSPPCCLISDMFSSATVASSCFLCIASSMRSQDFCKDGLRKLIGQAAELRFGLALLQHQSICLYIHMFTFLHMSSHVFA